MNTPPNEVLLFHALDYFAELVQHRFRTRAAMIMPETSELDEYHLCRYELIVDLGLAEEIDGLDLDNCIKRVLYPAMVDLHTTFVATARPDGPDEVIFLRIAPPSRHSCMMVHRSSGIAMTLGLKNQTLFASIRFGTLPGQPRELPSCILVERRTF